MYQGPVTRQVKNYRSKYIPGIGNVSSVIGVAPRTYERYDCDKCNLPHEVLGLATEPFYCRNCNALISIEAK